MSKISGKNHPKFINLTDTVVGKLTCLDYVLNPKEGSSRWVWKCQCKCGTICYIRTTALTRKNPQEQCKKCSDQYLAKAKTLENFGSLRNRIFRNYKRAAIKRGYSFELTFNEVQCLLDGNCYYCNSKPKEYTSDQLYKTEDKDFKRNGIDRVDNTQNYTVSNCVSCCSTCNTMKMDLPLKSFISHIKDIYLYYVEKSSTTIEKISDLSENN